MKLIDEYFQCVRNSGARFELAAPLSQDEGFFFFGEGTVYFGRTSTGFRNKRADQLLYDVSEDVSLSKGEVRLPFDPVEVVANLTHERYMRGDSNALAKLVARLVRHGYYGVRPVLPLKIRNQIQKIYLRNWRNLRFPTWPVDTTVNELANRLLSLKMKAAGVQRLPFIWFWPDGANACAIMTHDVEEDRGKQFCSEVMDMDEAFQIPASFQIVPERRYRITSEFITGIKSRGFEVNVQDLNHDGRLFWELEEFKRRAKRINQYGREFGAAGFRSAILYRKQEWFDLLDFDYDMSVPNVAHLDPQRGGCCTVMPYFIGGMLELPVTTTQDHSMFHILREYSLQLWELQMEKILKYNGLMSFVIHPDYIIDHRAREAYKRLLSELSRLRTEKNIWIAKPSEVNRWWRNRRSMSLKSKNGRWVIEGPGKEQARVALAINQQDEITFAFPEEESSQRVNPTTQANLGSR